MADEAVADPDDLVDYEEEEESTTQDEKTEVSLLLVDDARALGRLVCAQNAAWRVPERLIQARARLPPRVPRKRGRPKKNQVKKGSYVGIHASGFKDFILKPELIPKPELGAVKLPLKPERKWSLGFPGVKPEQPGVKREQPVAEARPRRGRGARAACVASSIKSLAEPLTH